MGISHKTETKLNQKGVHSIGDLANYPLKYLKQSFGVIGEEILITYYEDGYLLTNYMTVIDIDPLHSSLICTDAFYNKMTIQFTNIIDVK